MNKYVATRLAIKLVSVEEFTKIFGYRASQHTH